MLTQLYSYFQDFFDLFFPELCVSCKHSLVKSERSLCTSCIFHLPRTHFHLDHDNPVARTFWGRFPFIYASAFVYFQKGSRVQRIIHQLKYNNKSASGFKIGELYGHDLQRSKQWQDLDLIIPVPLHPKRERQRGYNQSEYIARGLASVLNIPISTTQLIKKNYTATQTKKTRFARYQNLDEAFEIQHGTGLEGKHILLIDDVITTGATLEACAIALLKVPGVRLSMVSIAFVG